MEGERSKDSLQGKGRGLVRRTTAAGTQTVSFVPRFMLEHKGCEKPAAGHPRASSATRWGCPRAGLQIHSHDPVENICSVSHRGRKPLRL